MRKRGAFVDLVHVAMADANKAKYLYVLGGQTQHFLTTTASSAAWGFTRKSALLRQRFEDRYGDADHITISEFFHRHADNVQIVDILDVLPGLQEAV